MAGAACSSKQSQRPLGANAGSIVPSRRRHRPSDGSCGRSGVGQRLTGSCFWKSTLLPIRRSIQPGGKAVSVPGRCQSRRAVPRQRSAFGAGSRQVLAPGKAQCPTVPEIGEEQAASAAGGNEALCVCESSLCAIKASARGHCRRYLAAVPRSPKQKTGPERPVLLLQRVLGLSPSPRGTGRCPTRTWCSSSQAHRPSHRT